MKTLAKNKNILAAVGLFVIGMFFYNFFFKSDKISISIDSETEKIAADMIRMFEELQAVSLNQNLFSMTGYLNLVDFSATIPNEAIGRTNPFDIIGR